MKWFGPVPYARFCADCKRVDIPTGEPCKWCGEPIAEGEQGVIIPPIEMALHYPCFFRSVTGSIGHQAGLCNCPGPKPAIRIIGLGTGLMDDPPGLTIREAAQAATEFYEAPERIAIRTAILMRWIVRGAEKEKGE